MLALPLELATRFVRAKAPLWLRDRIRSVAARRPGSPILGFVDRPVPGDAFHAWLDVEGWAFAADGRAVQVDIRVRGRTVRTVHPSLPRPDVERDYPAAAAGKASGFHARLRRSELPDRRRFWIVVTAAVPGPAGAGSRRRTLATIPVRTTRAAARHVRRGYQRVWDHDARTEEDARRAVSGTRDPGVHDSSGEATAGYVATQTGIGPDDVVLEIGCGVGRVGRTLAPRCGRWIGADVSPRMLRHARNALEGVPNVSFRQLSGLDLEGIPDESVDVAYCTAVFMHLEEWERFRYVTEMHRVLRPGGRVYFDSFNLLGEEGWGIFTRMAALDPAARPENIAKASTPEELRTYAERAGFEQIRWAAGALWVWVAAVKPGSDRRFVDPWRADPGPLPATPGS